MATHHGKNGVVKSGSNSLAEVTDFTITEGVSTADDSSMGDAAETHLTGINNWTASVKAHWDETDTNGQVTFTIGSSVTFKGMPEGAASGATYATGTASITGRTVSTPMGGVVEATFELKGNGALTWTTV